MDSTLADTMDSDTPMTCCSPSPELSGQLEVSRGLLTLARQLIHQGKPSEALQAVLTAMRVSGGEAAAIQVLNRAKELYRNKIYEMKAADELVSLFAECAIAEALPSIPELPPHALEADGGGPSILAESGRKQVVVDDAYCDGSSFVCLECGGLVSNNRKDEHSAFWCGHA